MSGFDLLIPLQWCLSSGYVENDTAEEQVQNLLVALLERG